MIGPLSLSENSFMSWGTYVRYTHTKSLHHLASYIHIFFLLTWLNHSFALFLCCSGGARVDKPFFSFSKAQTYIKNSEGYYVGKKSVFSLLFSFSLRKRMRVRDDEQVGKKEEGTTCTIKGKSNTQAYIHNIPKELYSFFHAFLNFKYLAFFFWWFWMLICFFLCLAIEKKNSASCYFSVGFRLASKLSSLLFIHFFVYFPKESLFVGTRENITQYKCMKAIE